MEGALGERLKREYGLRLDENVAMGPLVYGLEGRIALRNLWNEYAQIAAEHGLPFLATTPTRRTNAERIRKSAYDSTIIRANVNFLREVQTRQKAEIYVGGLLGCRGDAYTGKGALSREEARRFHEWEAELFAQAGVDFLYAALMPTVEEAAGMALAVEDKAPYIISFTIQQDGCLIDGTPIAEAIERIDRQTQTSPVGYMTNCVHPQIAYAALAQPCNRSETLRSRFIGIQANTSPLSYAELDDSINLKTSDPEVWAEEMLRLRELLPLKIFGGCCGTDVRHLREIAMRIE